MAFPQVQSITETTGSGTTHNIAMPATVNAGDLLIMIVCCQAAAINGDPSGWTVLRSDAQSPIYLKNAIGTEDGGSVAITTSSSQQLVAQVYRITGWLDSGTILNDVEYDTASGTSTAPNPPSLNPTNWGAEDTLWIACLAFTAGGVSAYPTNYTGGTWTNLASAKVASARRERNIAAEDPGTFTITTSTTWQAHTIAIRPEPEPTPKAFSDAGAEGTELFAEAKLKAFMDAATEGAESFLISRLKAFMDAGVEGAEAFTRRRIYLNEKRYSTIDIELSGDLYEDRIPQGAVPQVSQAVPEFFAGVELPQVSQFILSNLDNVITDLKGSGGFKRGKKVIISKGYGSISQGLATIDPAETYVEYRGLIDSSSIGERAVFNLLPSDIDVFDKEFPFEKVTTDLFPNAVDLDDDIPWIVGTAKQVPLALVLAQESPSQQYQYLVGRGDLTIDVVYRDRLAISVVPGTATATTTSTVTLEAGDQQADDYYNNQFIEMDGVVRKITDYVSSTNRATVTPTGSWTAGAYTIRTWKKVTTTISSVTYTLIEFARRQRDSSERMYQRDRMSADVTGLSTERNPARYIETLLGLFPDVALNSAGFTTAADAVTAEGNLFVDGALITRRRVFDILNQVCMIGRLRLRLNDEGEIYPVMDGTEDAIYGTFKYNDNIVSIGTPEQLPLSELWKTLALRYRVLFDEDDFRLTTAQHSVNSTEGRIDQVLDFDLIFDKTTADKVCDYLAKRKNSFDESLQVVLNHEARGRELGQLINLELNIPQKSGTYQIVKKELQGQGFGFAVIPYDATIFTYVAGSLPSDPVTDSQADFRFTPAPAVTGLGVSTASLPKNFKAIAKLSWTNPTSNFTDVLVQYKKTADSLYTSAGVVTGGGNSIEIVIETGTAYDYKVISFNQFRDPLLVGVATLLNQTSAGTSATPSTPGTPTLTVNFRGFQGALSSYTKPSNFLRFEWQYTDNGGSSVGGIFTSEGLVAPPLIESGTTGVTRRVKVRVIGAKSDGTEATGAYSSLSSAVSNEEVQRLHIRNGDITKVASDSAGSQTAFLNNLVSASLTVESSGKVEVWGNVNITNNGIGNSAGATYAVLRGTTTLVSRADAHKGFSDTENTEWSFHFVDTLSTGGSRTYHIAHTQGDTQTAVDSYISIAELER